jgi:hypothetical protein
MFSKKRALSSNWDVDFSKRRFYAAPKIELKVYKPKQYSVKIYPDAHAVARAIAKIQETGWFQVELQREFVEITCAYNEDFKNLLREHVPGSCHWRNIFRTPERHFLSTRILTT